MTMHPRPFSSKIFYVLVSISIALFFHIHSREWPWMSWFIFPSLLFFPQLFMLLERIMLLRHVNFLPILLPVTAAIVALSVGISLFTVVITAVCSYLFASLPINYSKDLRLDILQYLLTIFLTTILIGHDNILLGLPYDHLLGSLLYTSNHHILTFVKGLIFALPLLWLLYIPIKRNYSPLDLCFLEQDIEAPLKLDFAELIKLMSNSNFSLVDKVSDHYIFVTRTFIINRGRIAVRFDEATNSCILTGHATTLKELIKSLRTIQDIIKK